MRRVGSLWDGIISFDNLYRAWRHAFRSTKTPEAFAFTFNVEKELFFLQEELGNYTYQPGGYRYFTIYEPKERIISVAPFRDRVVHHALIQILEPIFERSFIYHSYATRKDKGSHKAIEQARCYLRKNRWYLKMDIAKYNVYLDPLVHYIKDRLGIKAYLRYMDDFCLFSNDKRTLKNLVSIITTFLEDSLGLQPKDRATLINTALHGLPFLGVRIWPSLIRVGRQNLARSLGKAGKISYQHYRSSMESILAHIQHWNTHKLLVQQLSRRH